MNLLKGKLRLQDQKPDLLWRTVKR